MPKPIFFAIAAGLAAIGFAVRRTSVREQGEQALLEQQRELAAKQEQQHPDRPTARDLFVDRIAIEFGEQLVPLALTAFDRDSKRTPVHIAREKLAQEVGVPLPDVRVVDTTTLEQSSYAIKLNDVVIGQSQLDPDRILVWNPDHHAEYAVDDAFKIAGHEMTEPVSGVVQAYWVPPELEPAAYGLGYVVQRPIEVLTAHFVEVCSAHAADILGRAETQQLLEAMKQRHENLVNELTGERGLSVGEIRRVLQYLLRERVAIRDMTTICETLADEVGRATNEGRRPDTEFLQRKVREALAPQITRQHCEVDGSLHMLLLSDAAIKLLGSAGHETDEKGQVRVRRDPELISRFANNIMAKVSEIRVKAPTLKFVLLVPSVHRLLIAQSLQRDLPDLPVLAFSEVARETALVAEGMVDI